MQPRLNEGDRVIFSYCAYRDDGKLRNGKVVYVRFAEGEAPSAAGSGCMVARFYALNGGRVLLRKDNPAWEPILMDRAAIQNLAVAVERREAM